MNSLFVDIYLTIFCFVLGPSPKHTIDVPNLEVKHQKGAVVIADSRDTIPLTASDLQDLSIDKFPTRKPAVLKIKGTEGMYLYCLCNWINHSTLAKSLDFHGDT